MNIIKKPTKNYGSRDGFVPEIVVVHIGDGSLSAIDSWFASPQSNASSHYSVALDGSVSQYVDEGNAAWANGRFGNPSFLLNKGLGINPNKYTISIENEGKDLSKSTQEQFKNLCILIEDICVRNKIPIDRNHIIGHYEIDSVNRMNCPSPDHSIMDKIVNSISPDTLVPLMCPRSKVQSMTNFINSLK